MNFQNLIASLSAALVLSACGMGVDADMGIDEEVQGDDTAMTGNELAQAVKGKFETFVGADGKHYFHLIAGNGELVLASEGYSSKQAAQNGIASVKTNGINEGRYLQREAVDGSAYFVLTAANGAIIGVSEMYATKSNATRAVGTVIKVVENTIAAGTEAAVGAKFESFKGLDGKYYFHLRAKNGEIIVQSQGYSSSSSAKNGIESVRTNGVDATKYTVLEAADGKFFFNLKSSNGRIIARSQTYANKSNATRGANNTLYTLSGGELGK